MLDGINEKTPIFNAWRDEPWINEGAAVRVSLVCFGKGGSPHLDGVPVVSINADLTSRSLGLDLTKAVALRENANVAFQGTIKTGPMDIPGDVARKWLQQPNVHGSRAVMSCDRGPTGKTLQGGRQIPGS